MISAHEHLIIPQYSSLLKHIQTVRLKWQRPKYTPPLTGHYTQTHTWIVILTLINRSKSIYSSANRWCSGKERESWKQSKRFESNLTISRQQFPVDLLDMKSW